MITYRLPNIEGTDDENDKHKYKLSMLCMVSFGVGEVLGCFFIGLFIDKLGSKISAVVNVVLVAVMGVVTIMFIKWPEYSPYIAHLMCFFWGF